MVAEPAATPVTTPEVETVATEVLLEDQAPPVVASLRETVDPAQTVVVPVMAATVGSELTVTVVLELEAQPAPFVTLYVIVVVPAATPVITPEASMVAAAVLLEDQVPPVVASFNVVVEPIHTELLPVMAATVSSVFTVTDTVELEVQPEAFVTV
jgi:hypothetical protein